MSDWPLLSLITFLPLVGAFFVFMIRGEKAIADRNARNVALWTTLITFALSLLLWSGFDTGTAGFQFVERAPWITEGIAYHLGVDGISMLFVILTTFPHAASASWQAGNRSRPGSRNT